MKSENVNSWKLILRRLQRGKAVLLLGPEVIMASQKENQPLKTVLQQFIKKDLEDSLDEVDLQRIEYYSEDGFFFLEDNYRLEVVESVLQFYEGQKVTDLYKKLAEIPFHLILSLSPDKVLGKAFEELDLPYHFHFYDKKNYNQKLDDEKLNFQPSVDNRLIYNVFGSVDNEDSLILSYDDLFEFLQKIFNNYSLPKTIRETILEANCFVFVGFNYSKWYLKLLLRLMNLQEKVRKVYGMDEPSRKEVETFFVNEFDMNFTRMDATTFVKELHEKCETEGLLLTKENVKQNNLPADVFEKGNTKIARAELGEAFEFLMDFCEKEIPPKEFHQTLVQLNSRFKRIRKDNQLGVLSYEQFNIDTNKVNRDLLDLLKEYK